MLAFLNIRTRHVLLSPATVRPDAFWVARQAETYVRQARPSGLRVRYVQCDRDAKFGAPFDAIVTKLRAAAVPSPAKSPNTQAFVERFIGSIRSECLNHFLFFGTRHLDSVIRAWLEHYHGERPHQGVGNELLVKRSDGTKSSPRNAPFKLRDVRCRRRLGGFIKHYERSAA